MYSLIEEFHKICKQNEANTALVSDYEGEFTYKQLNEYANYIAEELLKAEDENQVIGVCMERSFSMIAAVLGILKAGKAYLPLDPSYPQERLLFMLKKSRINTVVCGTGIKIPVKNRLVLGHEYVFRKDNLQMPSGGLAYVLYTSGSTGNPKGVMVHNESIMNTLNWCIQYYHLNCEDVVLQIPSFSFSSSIEDIFSTLLSGGKLVMIQPKDLMNVKKLCYYIKKYKVTHFLMVPSLYNQVAAHLRNTELKFIVLAGEALRQEIIEKHFAALPNVCLYNEYGMTETSVAFSACQIYKHSEPYLIGKPISNMEYIIKDMDDMGIGELTALGIGVAEGYHNESIEQNERFGFLDGRKAFFTGDYVKETIHGELSYLGRKDQQIKVNGQRVDLSEINAAASGLKDVRDTAVTVIEIHGRKKILCLIQTEHEGVRQEAEKRLKLLLPQHYMPNYIWILKKFCYLPNGKTDIKKMKEDFLQKLKREEEKHV